MQRKKSPPLKSNKVRSLVRLFVRGCFPLLLFFTLAYAQGTGIPPNESRTIGTKLPDVMLIDSHGKSFNLYSLSGKPIILSPIYTHCSSACPIITDSLKKVVYKLGTPGRDFWVLSFTFDPKDRLEDLRRFQKEHGIDGRGWKVVMAKDSQELFKLTDAIDFRFMSEQNSRDFIHPNLLVFISADMVIKKYVYGVVFKYEDMKKALDYAEGNEDLLERLRPYLFFVGLLGFGVSSLYLLLKIFKR